PCACKRTRTTPNFQAWIEETQTGPTISLRYEDSTSRALMPVRNHAAYQHIDTYEMQTPTKTYVLRHTSENRFEMWDSQRNLCKWM
ncbi:hypothetical protein AVEN_207112-1, partial [Araneus ventricosus]